MKDYLKLAYLSVLSETSYHLLLKKSNIDGYDYIITLFWFHISMLFFLLIHYYFYDTDKRLTDVLNNKKFVMIFLIGGFLSYITHVAGYYAFLNFRNPGYFQGLLSLELILMTLISYLLFGSHIGIKEIIAIGLIIAGSVLITWDE